MFIEQKKENGIMNKFVSKFFRKDREEFVQISDLGYISLLSLFFQFPSFRKGVSV